MFLSSKSYSKDSCSYTKSYRYKLNSESIYQGITFGWKNFNEIFNKNNLFNAKDPLLDLNKEFFLPIIYFGFYTNSQSQELIVEKLTVNGVLKISFKTKFSEFSIPTVGQPFELLLVPKNCKFYININ